MHFNANFQSKHTIKVDESSKKPRPSAKTIFKASLLLYRQYNQAHPLLIRFLMAQTNKHYRQLRN